MSLMDLTDLGALWTSSDHDLRHQCSTSAEVQSDPEIIIHTYSQAEERVCILESLRPRFVVMYDPEPSFIRTLERYQAANQDPADRVKLYLMTYEASTEEKRFLQAVKREKDAFKSLIDSKANLAPLQMRGLEGGPLNIPAAESAGLSAILDTRTVKKGVVKAITVVVDVREFRSSLPSFLHEKGLKLDPVTLTVGDFVLTPHICVERKSVSDLFSSLNSGRLYNQVTSCHSVILPSFHPPFLLLSSYPCFDGSMFIPSYL